MSRAVAIYSKHSMDAFVQMQQAVERHHGIWTNDEAAA